MTPIAGRALDRVVAVLTPDSQGSGVLLHTRLVLIASHVVDIDDVVEVIHPWGSGPVRCEVVWADESLDAALLAAESDVISPERAAPLGRMRLGRIATSSHLPHCDIVGLPRIQRYGDEGQDLEYDHYRASVLPMAGRMRNVVVCELDVPAVDERGKATSPLAGLSGAPVFAGAVLLGVVNQVPQGRSHLRIEAIPITTVISEAQFQLLKWNFNVEEVTDLHPQDELFEVRYAKDLAAQYRKTEIFGIEELGRGESRWDLDTAYLSLEAEAVVPGKGQVYGDHADALRKGTGTSARRIDALLTERPRALLRGQAGAGKTTLVWWLAAHAANSTLNENLAELNGLVPFVIPMREVYARGGRFPAVSELLSAGPSLSGDAPDAWANRVMEAGRGLLLVDGLDEVPPPKREEARRWLSALLERYPRTRCMATVRPDAVDKDWLRADGFTELTLMPMSDEDIQDFVKHWHDAARLECERLYEALRCVDERALLTTLEQDLAHQLGQNTALRDLARTPLLCAVICALHRSRRGLLPTTRWSLYRAALAMLLGGRDAGRGVARPDDIDLNSEALHDLLQRLAIWLVRTEQQQMTHEEATQQLALAIPDIPQMDARTTTPARVLNFLLERSGLIHERTDNTVEFIHRTFQDFLAAKEFHETGYLPELVKNAGDEAWRDVIVLSVGHATRKEAKDLIEEMVKLGDAAETRDRKWYLHVLGAECVASRTSLDAGLTELVRERVGALMPPRSPMEARDIARLGAWAVELLPGPDRVDGTTAVCTVIALTGIRTTEARQQLRQFAMHPESNVGYLISDGWQHQPAEEYAREVLAGAGLSTLVICNRSQLAQLSVVGPVRSIMAMGPYSAEQLEAHLPTRGVEGVYFIGNKELTHLDFLKKQQDLRSLSVSACTELRDLSALSDLHHLERLELRGVRRDVWKSLRPLQGVRELSLPHGSDEWFEDLAGWTSLEELELDGEGRDASEILRATSGAPRLTRLTLPMASLRHLTAVTPLPNIRRLRITGLSSCVHTTQLRRVFPSLEELVLMLEGDVEEPLDLTALHDLPDLEVCVDGRVGSEPRIVGAEAFGTRFTNQLTVSEE